MPELDSLRATGEAPLLACDLMDWALAEAWFPQHFRAASEAAARRRIPMQADAKLWEYA